MYGHILVPLDGSDLAEQVLPHLRTLVRQDKSTRITLLRAVSPIYPITTEYSGAFLVPVEEMASAMEEAETYLQQVAEGLRREGYNVTIEVCDLPAAEAIVDYAEYHDVDLITIATHGRSGVSRWIFGSVTQKVLHATRVPTLVVRPVT